MIEIPLTQGMITLIDDEDADRVLRHKWFAVRTKKVGLWYAMAKISSDKARRSIYLHRFITSAPAKVEVDHVNRNGLDNRRANLRFATRAQQICNSRHRASNTGFRGVSFDNRRSSFFASIRHEKRTIFLGRFTNAEDAARAYDEAARKLYGEFAWLNFPQDASLHNF